jgi:predicted nucleic acid-binding protein
MTFDEMSEGTTVYLDANVFLYDFNGASKDCARLIQRCREESIYGITSCLTLAEFCHRAMCMEAQEHLKAKGIKVGRPRDYLEEHPDTVKILHKYIAAIDEILLWARPRVLSVDAEQVRRSKKIRQRYGLLTNDSLVVQILLDNDIQAIATNDTAFSSIEGLRVFRPNDINPGDV